MLKSHKDESEFKVKKKGKEIRFQNSKEISVQSAESQEKEK